MATLKQLELTIDTLRGDLPMKNILENSLNILELGRRGGHGFVVRSNIRQLKSGPKRGLIRIDGAVLVMFGNRNRRKVETAIVRKGANFLPTLDKMATKLTKAGY